MNVCFSGTWLAPDGSALRRVQQLIRQRLNRQRYGAGREPREGFTLTQAQVDEWRREERAR